MTTGFSFGAIHSLNKAIEKDGSDADPRSISFHFSFSPSFSLLDFYFYFFVMVLSRLHATSTIEHEECLERKKSVKKVYKRKGLSIYIKITKR